VGLETLIVILVILIIGILADGVRRMLKERNNRLRLRIDPKAKELAKQPYDEVNPELPSGGARVLPRTGAEVRTPGLAIPAARHMHQRRHRWRWSRRKRANRR